MDGLQELARSTFDDQQHFDHDNSDFDLINISALPPNDISYEELLIPESELLTSLDHTTSPIDGEGAEPTLKIVQILRNDNDSLVISQGLFREIFESFKFESYILYLISRNSYGFHCFAAENSASNFPQSFFLGTVLYALVWSFDPQTFRTRAILLPRRSNGLGNANKAFHEFKKILRLYKNLVYTPRLLAFVASIHIIHFVDTFILSQLASIRRIEASTKTGAWGSESFGTHGSHGDEMSRTHDGRGRRLRLEKYSYITGISQSSKTIGGCIVNLANNLRHEEIATSLLAFLHEDDHRAHFAQDHHRQKHSADGKVYKSLVPTLQVQVESAKSYIRYLQERARNQSSVLFAIANLDMAEASRTIAEMSKRDSSAMRQLAQDSKKDSTAMKTIAIMTMAFLPATFFAALFAVPSLQWDKPRVVQDTFWIYWAFTLPCTALVFILWFFVTNWNSIFERKKAA